ncbi:hypothetical protein Tco_1460384 [Tanacetum coccineum]
MERMIAKAILQERRNLQSEISSQIQKAIDNQIPSQVDASVRSYMYGYILYVHPAQSQTLSVPEQQYWKRISEKRTENQAKTNKTEHEMEKREKTKSNQTQSPRKSK